jgi:hypothetical protein
LRKDLGLVERDKAAQTAFTRAYVPS